MDSPTEAVCLLKSGGHDDTSGAARWRCVAS